MGDQPTKKEVYTFPDKLEDFGYAFKDGKLTNIKTGEGFEFKVKEDTEYNQQHYEALGETITNHIYGLMEDAGLKRMLLSESDGESEDQSFVFISEDLTTNTDKLLVLVHGSGVVRAGQWARRLIINDGLEYGTQLPYIKRGMDDGYSIVVLNTNLNTFTVDGESNFITGHGSPEEHGSTVWKNVITKSPAKNVMIVAHSYGGVVITDMACVGRSEMLSRVKAIAFTDSVHYIPQGAEDIGEFYQENSFNWVSSEEELDTTITDSDPTLSLIKDAPRISAGHSKHEWTSSSAMESVFKFFNKKLSAESLENVADNHQEMEEETCQKSDEEPCNP